MRWTTAKIWTPHASFWGAIADPLAWDYMVDILNDHGGYLAACWGPAAIPRIGRKS